MDTPDTLHAFWFGTSPQDAEVIASQSALWWQKQPAVDTEIRKHFAPLVERAATGEQLYIALMFWEHR